MHTVGGDVKAIFSMLAGAAFCGKQGETNYNIEHCLNGRWQGGFPRPADHADQVWPLATCQNVSLIGWKRCWHILAHSGALSDELFRVGGTSSAAAQ